MNSVWKAPVIFTKLLSQSHVDHRDSLMPSNFYLCKLRHRTDIPWAPPFPWLHSEEGIGLRNIVGRKGLSHLNISEWIIRNCSYILTHHNISTSKWFVSNNRAYSAALKHNTCCLGASSLLCICKQTLMRENTIKINQHDISRPMFLNLRRERHPYKQGVLSRLHDRARSELDLKAGKEKWHEQRHWGLPEGLYWSSCWRTVKDRDRKKNMQNCSIYQLSWRVRTLPCWQKEALQFWEPDVLSI